MKKKSYLFFICILILLLIISLLSNFNLYDKKRFLQSLLIVMSFIGLYGSLQVTNMFKWLISTIFIIGSLSALLSTNPAQSFLHLIHIYLLLSLIVLGIYLKDKINYLFYLLFFSNIFLVSSSLLNYSFFLLDKVPPTADGILYGFRNIRFFNQFQIICIPITVHYLNHKKLSRIATAALTINILLFLVSGARGAIISSMIMVCFGLHLNLINKKILIKLIKCSFFASIIFYLYASYHSGVNAYDYTFRITSSGRLDIWGDLVSKLTLKNIFIGYGPGSYFISEMRLSHPHNSILQILYNWGGIVSFIVMATLYNLSKKCVILLKSPAYDSAFNTCLLVTISLLSYSLFSGVIVMPLPQTFLFIFIGLLVSYTIPTIKRKKRSLKHLIIATSLATMYIGTVLLSYKCISQTSYGPGFWSNGQFSLSECPTFKGN